LQGACATAVDCYIGRAPEKHRETCEFLKIAAYLPFAMQIAKLTLILSRELVCIVEERARLHTTQLIRSIIRSDCIAVIESKILKPFQIAYQLVCPALPEKKVVSLERGPLSLVSTTEELLDRKVAAPV
jgi:hypothetical protein